MMLSGFIIVTILLTIATIVLALLYIRELSNRELQKERMKTFLKQQELDLWTTIETFYKEKAEENEDK